MNYLIVLALSVVTVTAFDLRNKEISIDNPRSIIAPLNEIGGRIANGEDATEGMIPHQVGLSITKAQTRSWCGGSIISSQYVMTAAHCADKAIWISIIMGSIDRTSGAITLTVSSDKIIVHEQWNPSTLLNDIAVIRIPTIQMSWKIQAVKLPSKSSSSQKFAGEEALISGWGLQGDSATTVANRLQWGNVTIIANKECARSYGSVIDKTKICAETPDRISTCQGDSGGPLTLKYLAIQVGLVSFGSARGCELGHPIGFTRLTEYLDWIEEKTGISY